MAGETPGAAAAGNNRRRNTNWNDNKSTNKIYASGDISALGDYQTVADSTLKPGQRPAANPTPTMRADDKSADKYYAESGSSRVRGAQVAKQERDALKKLGPPPTLGVNKQRAKPADPNRLVINDRSEINGVLDNVVARLANGETGLVVFIKDGERDVLKRARACLEMLVAREVITEDQQREVRLSYQLSHAEQADLATKLDAPKATKTARTEDNEAVDDPMAFLNGEEGDDDEVDTSPAETTEVDTSKDPADASIPSTPLPEDDEDEGDFLADDAKPASGDETVEEPAPAELKGDDAPAPAEDAANKPARKRRGNRTQD